MDTKTFTLSTGVLEPAEKAQVLTEAANSLQTFLPQEARCQIIGIEKGAYAPNATGQYLQHFGFYEVECEDELVGAKAADTFRTIGASTATPGSGIITHFLMKTTVTTIIGIIGVAVGAGIIAAFGGIAAATILDQNVPLEIMADFEDFSSYQQHGAKLTVPSEPSI